MEAMLWKGDCERDVTQEGSEGGPMVGTSMSSHDEEVVGDEIPRRGPEEGITRENYTLG